MDKPSSKKSDKPVLLDNWSVNGASTQAPDCRKTYLSGKVFGHPKKKDGSIVRTSRVVSAKGRLVTTKSGTCYKLGKINPEYRTFLRKNNLAYDARDPIKGVDVLSDIVYHISCEDKKS